MIHVTAKTDFSSLLAFGEDMEQVHFLNAYHLLVYTTEMNSSYEYLNSRNDL